MYDCVVASCQDGPVIDHLGINCADWEKSKIFYDEVLGVLGYTRQLDYQVAIGYGTEGKPDFWIADMNVGEAAGPNREVHVAFHAKDPTPSRRSTTPRSNSGPSHCMRRGCGPSTTPVTSARSSATRTATTSRRSSTALRRSNYAKRRRSRRRMALPRPSGQVRLHRLLPTSLRLSACRRARRVTDAYPLHSSPPSHGRASSAQA